MNKNTGTDSIIWTEKHIFVASTQTEINENNDDIIYDKIMNLGTQALTF